MRLSAARRRSAARSLDLGGRGGSRRIAADATPADLAAVRAGMARADRRLAAASELLGLALALPRGRLRTLGERTRRIVALGEELLAG